MIEDMKKSAMVAIVGRPSAGKSTLMNKLCGEKISIVTPVPQTTRNRIKGILNDEAGQIVFLDTPGFHNSLRKYNLQLKNLTTETLADCEIILYLVDASRRMGNEEQELISLLISQAVPVVLAFNKCDIANPDELEQKILAVASGDAPTPTETADYIGTDSADAPAAGDAFAGVFRISADTGDGLEELKSALFELSPEAEPLYPEEYYTDQEPEFRIAEIIRERAMLKARDELPHAMFVEIQDLEVRENPGSDQQQLWVRATLFVENKSQVGLVVGKGGAGIKAIRTESQKEIGRVFPYRVHLDLRVKPNPRWRRNDHILRRIVN